MFPETSRTLQLLLYYVYSCCKVSDKRRLFHGCLDTLHYYVQCDYKNQFKKSDL